MKCRNCNKEIVSDLDYQDRQADSNGWVHTTGRVYCHRIGARNSPKLIKMKATPITTKEILKAIADAEV